ncbi:ArsR/SmtB family transcription factor [Kineothrix sedimenti]|uniref:Winged helix-turn-helix transcriptional regulator n=1 Tax=Kineothrix sedimenti TaxID=3123317 RepID=A0ABZ3ETW5_9FIRM
MLHIKSLDEGLEIFKALGSEVRIEIIKILLENHGMNMNELASRLNITNGALTSHIKKLEDCGLINVSSESRGHGNQKKCSVHLDKILIDMDSQEDFKNVYQTDLKVGHFSDYKVYPTCGLASNTAIIGEVDDTRYFAHPDRYNADILWFTRGYVEYVIPNFIPFEQKIDQITISLELCSEAPGVNDVWPSDISFILNDKKVAMWTSPGDFGNVGGIFTPDWWYPNWNQYGLLKILVINKKGTFIDGLQVSDVSTKDFNLDYRSTMKLKLEVEDDAKHVGGLTIFGKTFGNYNQDISVRINYSPIIVPEAAKQEAVKAALENETNEV